MISKNKKKEIIDDLNDSLKDSKSIVFAKFDRLRVSDANSLRRKLQGQNVSYKVTKKTLLKKALLSEKISGEMPEIPGQIAIAYASDLLSPAREIFDFQKSHKENMEIVGGVFDGKYMNASEMLSIATIPPIEVLRGMFVNLINSPIQRFAVVLDQIAQGKVSSN